MDAERLKQERTISKGAFTRLANGLMKAIETGACHKEFHQDLTN